MTDFITQTQCGLTIQVEVCGTIIWNKIMFTEALKNKSAWAFVSLSLTSVYLDTKLIFSQTETERWALNLLYIKTPGILGAIDFIDFTHM